MGLQRKYANEERVSEEFIRKERLTTLCTVFFNLLSWTVLFCRIVHNLLRNWFIIMHFCNTTGQTISRYKIVTVQKFQKVTFLKNKENLQETRSTPEIKNYYCGKIVASKLLAGTKNSWTKQKFILLNTSPLEIWKFFWQQTPGRKQSSFLIKSNSSWMQIFHQNCSGLLLKLDSQNKFATFFVYF